ncbi:hypothetical protein AAMO2058_001604100 [Amorphochlora amoebiformis]
MSPVFVLLVMAARVPPQGSRRPRGGGTGSRSGSTLSRISKGSGSACVVNDADVKSRDPEMRVNVPGERTDVARVYVVVHKNGALVRSGIDLKSRPVHTFKFAEEVQLWEIRGRRARVKYPGPGWLSIRTSRGDPILIPKLTKSPKMSPRFQEKSSMLHQDKKGSARYLHEDSDSDGEFDGGAAVSLAISAAMERKQIEMKDSKNKTKHSDLAHASKTKEEGIDGMNDSPKKPNLNPKMSDLNPKKPKKDNYRSSRKSAMSNGRNLSVLAAGGAGGLIVGNSITTNNRDGKIQPDAKKSVPMYRMGLEHQLQTAANLGIICSLTNDCSTCCCFCCVTPECCAPILVSLKSCCYASSLGCIRNACNMERIFCHCCNPSSNASWCAACGKAFHTCLDCVDMVPTFCLGIVENCSTGCRYVFCCCYCLK